MTLLWAVGAFFLVLTPIILVHELGHFWAARKSGIKVDEFGLGFPPRAAVLFERGGTIFTYNWIPLGGFVRPAGEDDPTVAGGLASASKRARLFVLSAGAIANFIFAFFLFWIAFILGAPGYDESRVMVQDVAPDSPAMVAGLAEGDLIVAVNGQPVGGNTELLITEIHANAGRQVDLVIERDGQALNLVVTPRLPGEYSANQGPTGIALGFPFLGRQPMNVVNASVAAGRSIWQVFYGTVTAPVMLVRGQLDPSLARPVSVVGISQIAGRAAESSASTGDPFQILFFTAVISVALGFTNLLPIPALDGGRIMFVLLEAVRGRRIEPEREGMVHLAGMLFLLGLMALIIIQDIVNPILPF